MEQDVFQGQLGRFHSQDKIDIGQTEVGVHKADLVPHGGQSKADVHGHGRLAGPALAAGKGNDPCLRRHVGVVQDSETTVLISWMRDLM